MKYLWIPLVLAMPLSLTQCNKVEKASENVASAGDYSLAKNTFEGLTHGDVEVAKNIDWETLRTPAGDFGAAYVQIPTETEKQTKQKTFILDFASSYQKGGAAPYSNWKVSFHDAVKTEVTADSAGGRLVLTVTTRDGKERLSAIDFLK